MMIGIVFDSVFGNTAQIARAIAAELQTSHEVRLAPVAETSSLDVSAMDLLIVGSPTRGFRPTPAITEFIGGLSDAAGRSAAAFDTRLNPEDIHPAPLRWVVQAGGYAADRIGVELGEKGYDLKGAPGDFLVSGTEGPLKPGEVERAKEWARSLVA